MPSIQERRVAWRNSGRDVDFEEEVESRIKLDEQKRKLQKELREVEKFSCFSEEVQESLKGNLQQRWSKGGMTPCQSTRNCRKDHKIYKVFRKKEICKKKVLQHKRSCGRSEWTLTEMRSDFGNCRTKSIGTKWLMQKWQQLLHGDDGGTTLRYGCRSSEVQVRCHVPGVLQEIRGLLSFCADARKRMQKKEW